ncbi:MAG: TIGR00159 family protein [Clostridia bacterium]|jgi:diadenylate cyclase|nr:TIGR00159 family protein [Clostridia bacterium]
MNSNLITSVPNNLMDVITSYAQELYDNPLKLIVLMIDISIVILLIVKLFKIVKDSRAWQLLKGICIFIIAMGISSLLHLNILNYILTSFVTYGTVFVVLFQPELRRSLEELGSNKLNRFFGIDKDIETKTKEEIYKVAIAAFELSKEKTGALIVIERDIEIKDIIATGVLMDSEISPQLLVNIFVPKTPLHDGAVVISGGRIKAAACMLPLAGDKDIARELGTRHRAGIGISKESDAIAIVVSEETGKVSIAKDGTLIADVKEETLKKILIKNLIIKRKLETKREKLQIIKKHKQENNK